MSALDRLIIRSVDATGSASGLRLMLSRELNDRRALRIAAGFGTNCLQSEMILPHMPVQPGSYSLRHMFMHSR
jgi:hypothetical protein